MGGIGWGCSGGFFAVGFVVFGVAAFEGGSVAEFREGLAVGGGDVAAGLEVFDGAPVVFPGSAGDDGGVVEPSR